MKRLRLSNSKQCIAYTIITCGYHDIHVHVHYYAFHMNNKNTLIVKEK